MPIKANNFVWANAPTPDSVPETITTDKPLASDFDIPKSIKRTPEDFPDDEFLNLNEDGTLKVKRSEYTEDMMSQESEETINTTTDNKKE